MVDAYEVILDFMQIYSWKREEYFNSHFQSLFIVFFFKILFIHSQETQREREREREKEAETQAEGEAGSMQGA